MPMRECPYMPNRQLYVLARDRLDAARYAGGRDFIFLTGVEQLHGIHVGVAKVEETPNASFHPRYAELLQACRFRSLMTVLDDPCHYRLPAGSSCSYERRDTPKPDTGMRRRREDPCQVRAGQVRSSRTRAETA